MRLVLSYNPLPIRPIRLKRVVSGEAVRLKARPQRWGRCSRRLRRGARLWLDSGSRVSTLRRVGRRSNSVHAVHRAALRRYLPLHHTGTDRDK